MASLLEEKDAIRDVLSAYCFYMDNGEFDRWAALFAEDGIFETARGIVEGRMAIRDYVVKGLPHPTDSKHCTLNSIIQVRGAEATVDSYIIVVRKADPGIVTSLAGRYEDLLVKQEDAWRFKVRKIHSDISGG